MIARDNPLMDVWKKFEENGLTHSSVHHLMAIASLLKENGYARGIDVANYLDISRSSVSVTLHKLLAKGYITEDSNKFYQLTVTGNAITNDVLSTRRIVKKFFKEILGVSEQLAEEDACQIEHLLHHKTSQKLFKFINFMDSESKKGSDILERFRSFEHNCSGDCDVCDEDCFYAKSSR